ncbi:MAG: hypothetical protein ACO3BG_02810 [Candidatus Nanopelagicales bacterium]
MQKKRLISLAFISFIISSFLISPSFAEGEEAAPVETPVEESYVPPAEANEGVGGWAVVDPNTGAVHGVIVCTADVCGPSGSWGGKLPGEYMGCTNCNLRFQTRATADGNVAGWHGTQTNIDANGNATQTNDGSVTWNEKERNFTISNKSTDGKGNSISSKSTLIPEKTALDGKNLQTGIINQENQYTSNENSDSVTVTTLKENIDSNENVTVKFSKWENDPLLKYESIQGFIENIDSDVENALISQGENTEDPENEMVKTIKTLTTKVKDFVSNLFGFNRTELAS